MQAQSRLGSAAADEQHYEAVVRELRRGRELTARLQAEATRALRGQGQAEATAAFILREVSRAFTVCISIMGGAAPAPATPTPLAGAARRPRDDGATRKMTVTTSPNSDGYLWRKYGQKRIMKTRFPRCYYRCSHHRERGCPATKQVQEQPQQHGDDHPKTYLVIYVHEHTCRAPPSAEPAEALGGRFVRDDDVAAPAAALDGRGAQEELERQVLVSSLACVLQGRHTADSTTTTTWGGKPAAAGGSPSSSSRQQLGRISGDDAGALEMPPLTSSSLGAEEEEEEEEELDVMDYDVPGDDAALCFGGPSTYGML